MEILLRNKYIFKISSVEERFELFDGKYQSVVYLTGTSIELDKDGFERILVLSKNKYNNRKSKTTIGWQKNQ